VTLVDENDAIQQVVVCRVFQRKGVSAVRMEPDIVMMNRPPELNSHELVAAVLAYHRQQIEKPRSG
jgi:hypothetical protein